MSDDDDIGQSFWHDLLRMEIRIVAGSDVDFDESTFSALLDFAEPESILTKDVMRVAKSMVLAKNDRVLNGNYLDSYFKTSVDTAPEGDLEQRLKILERTIQRDYECTDVDSRIASLMILFCGVAALQEFLCCNWTGPLQGEARPCHFVSTFFADIPNPTQEAMKLLSEDGEVLYNNVLYPELLLLAKTLISSARSESCMSRDWWLLRCSILHQRSLEVWSASLKSYMKKLIPKILEHEGIKANDNLKVIALLEAGQISLFYHEIIPATEYLSAAKGIVGIDIELSGALGKRTRFQKKAVSQLYVKVKHNHEFPNAFTNALEDSPEDLWLNDDLLLNKVEFMDKDTQVVSRSLNHLEQVVLLLECCIHQRTSANEHLLFEELSAYVRILLNQPNLWSTRIMTLYLRSRLEKQATRKKERSMMQLETLVASARKGNDNMSQRQCLFFTIQFPPTWLMEKEMADILVSLGAVKSALEIYERLNLWENVISCHQVLGQNERAANIIQERLDEEQTPLLWCILGDVTDDISCYEKALQLSSGKCSRAHRSIGYHYYKKKDYKSCIVHFEKALNLNHLQLNVWFSVAFAHMMEKDYDAAARAYRNVVNLDPENFEAWNNLSNAYIKLKQKERAYRTLQESLKCNYENWRIWENFLIVCVDIGAFEDAIHAYHRLLDIKGKHEDIEVLQIMVTAVNSDLTDFSGQPCSRLNAKVRKLFGRITSIIVSNAKIWKMYSLLYSSDPNYEADKGTMECVLNYLKKSFKYAIVDENWIRKEGSCRSVISDSLDLANAYLSYMKIVDDSIKCQNKVNAKMMLKSVIVRVEKKSVDFSSEFREELTQSIVSLRKKLEDVESA